MTAAERILPLLSGLRPTATDKWVSLCPGHPDKNPSCSWMYKDGRMVGHCFSGCSMEDIVKAIGLTLADLFDDASGKPNPKQAFVRTLARDLSKWRENEALRVGSELRERDRRIGAVNDKVKAGQLTEENALTLLAPEYRGYSALEFKFEQLRDPNIETLQLWERRTA